MRSHPMWVRGLKHHVKNGYSPIRQVAPYVGAWIETDESIGVMNLIPSHPMWVRGLKHIIESIFRIQFRVAPYVGAWIETW